MIRSFRPTRSNLNTKSKFVCVLIFVIAMLALTTHTAHAAPLYNVPVIITQPDGRVLYLFASGDEFYNWLHDKQGYTILQDPINGYYVYADLVDGQLIPTKHIAGRVDPASVGLQPYLNISPEKMTQIRQAYESMAGPENDIQYAPTTGVITNLVIFIRFSDEAEFVTGSTKYMEMLNDATVGANSMLNYFQEVSYNKLTINSMLLPLAGTTVVSYRDSQPRNYYRPYNAVTNPIGYEGGMFGTERFIREHTLLRDAINYVGGLGQFPSGATIDGNGDGVVDSVTFIISGSPDGWSELIWPHMYKFSLVSIRSSYDNVIIDGKTVEDYAFQLDAEVDTGVLAHEMFHVLGSPDLYHYSLDKFKPVGVWDVMESSLNPPRHMGCHMKYQYGKWISSIPEITSPGRHTLNPLTSPTNNCYKIASPNSTSEYFLVEYRRQESSPFEASLPGSGLLVYRINTALEGNSKGPPDEVYIYRPGGTSTENGDVDSANFSSNVGRTAINDTTNPSSFLSKGGPGGLDICNIGASGATISFDVFCGKGPEMDVHGNQISIADGDTTPSTSDHTDFGSIAVAGGSITRTYTIINTGYADLNFSDSPRVRINGAHAANFTVSAQPSSPVAPDGSTTFTVVFDPDAAGLRTATLSIANNDSDENPYNFVIQGAGATDDSYEENNTPATAYDLSDKEGIDLSSVAGPGIQADDDWYRIYVDPGNEEVVIGAGFVHSEGDIDIALYDSAGAVITFSQSTADLEYINYIVPAGGVYYIWVGYGNQGNQYDLVWDDLVPSTLTCYALTLAHTGTGSDPTASPSNSAGCSSGQYRAGEAIVLTAYPSPGYHVDSWTGTGDDTSIAMTNTVTMPAGAHPAGVNYVQDPVPCYQLTLTHTGTGSDPTASPPNSAGCSSGQYVAGAAIALTADPASGYHVGSWTGTDNNGSASANNTLTMPPSAHVASAVYVIDAGNDDNYEENNTLAAAFDLSDMEGRWLSSVAGYGIQADDDWYRIYVEPGSEEVVVDVRFTHSEGDIDIGLIDSEGTVLTSSVSIADFEYIDYVVPAGGVYYIGVSYGNRGNLYDLWWADLAPGNLPGDFSKSEPANEATVVSTSPILSWYSSAGGAGYEYCYDTIDDNICGEGWTSTGTFTWVSLTGLSLNTTYYWQARAVTASGKAEANGGTWWSFTPAAWREFEIFIPLALR